MLEISSENTGTNPLKNFLVSFVYRKVDKKTNVRRWLYKFWSAGQFHIQNLLSTEKKMTERVPNLTWTFYGWRPLLRCIQPSGMILQHKTRKKKHCNMRKWAFNNWQLFFLLLYLKTPYLRTYLSLDTFAPELAVLRLIKTHFKDFTIFETTSRWKLVPTRAAYSREKCASKRGTDELGTTLHTNQGGTKHAEYNLLCCASCFATLNLFITKKNNSHTVLYAHTVS